MNVFSILTVHIGGEVLRGGSRIQRNCLFIVVIRKGGGWQRGGCIGWCLKNQGEN